MISLVFAVAVMAGAADPAQASKATPTAAAPSATPTNATKADKNEMVCKREPVLGSRMKERVCMTQADWDQRKADARAEMERVQTNIPAK